MIEQPTSNKFLNPVQWWVLFAVNTYLMAQVFQTFREFTLQPTASHLLILLGIVAALSLMLGLQLFDSYVNEKNKGNVHNQVPLFEWFLRLRSKSTSAQTSQVHPALSSTSSLVSGGQR
ncbi:MAG: hypothetical protein K2X66_07075, partial [Cyanobacteria bacterium]|nr:hypothetical protein [Cyanobacteriota bacterium]